MRSFRTKVHLQFWIIYEAGQATNHLTVLSVYSNVLGEYNRFQRGLSAASHKELCFINFAFTNNVYFVGVLHSRQIEILVTIFFSGRVPIHKFWDFVSSVNHLNFLL